MTTARTERSRRGLRATGGPAPRRPREDGDGVRGLARVVGELMLTAGAVLLLFVGWQLFGTGIATARAQHDLRSELTRQWDRQAGGAAGRRRWHRPARWRRRRAGPSPS